MKLSLALIAERLKTGLNLENSGNCSEDFCLERAAFYIGEQVLESNTLYISRTEDLKKEPELPGSSAVIYTGKQLHFEPDDRYLAVGSMDILKLGNAVLEIFQMFYHWEQELEDTGDSEGLEGMFREMLECSTPVFENGLCLMNSSFRILAQTEVNRRYGDYEKITDFYDPGDVAPDIMSMLRADKGYQKITEGEKVLLMEDTVLPYRTLNRNIYVEGAFAYRLVVTECIRPFRRSDEMLLQILAEHIVRATGRISGTAEVWHMPLTGILTDIIRRDIINKAALDMELRSLGWNHSDRFCVLCMRSGQSARADNTEQYYCMEMMKEFPACFAFPAEQNIVVIFNESVFSGTLLDFFRELAIFIRENNFRVGTSNPFQDLYRLRKYYRQAEIVLDIGTQENPSEWRHSFGDYVLNYIYSMATSEFEKEELYSPVYRRLRQYDEENKTEFLQTLKCYLDNQMNVVRTAQELYIHRSTMIYRLKRICEIGQTSLKDQEELLHLNLTFHLLA